MSSSLKLITDEVKSEQNNQSVARVQSTVIEYSISDYDVQNYVITYYISERNAQGTNNIGHF
jgi:hypothetical protein